MKRSSLAWSLALLGSVACGAAPNDAATDSRTERPAPAEGDAHPELLVLRHFCTSDLQCGGSVPYCCNDVCVAVYTSSCNKAPPPPSPVAPRLIAPLSTAKVTSQSPTLHWGALASGTSGVYAELCYDRTCASPIPGASFYATGTSGVVPVALPAGVVFWRVYGTEGTALSASASPVWQMNVGHRSAPRDTSWGTTPDLNGDGYSDVIVGESINHTTNDSSGRVSLYYSRGTTGIATSPSTILSGTYGSLFGNVVSSLGDVNGDGFADLGVLAPGNGGSVASAVLVYLGGPSGISASPITVSFPTTIQSMASAGDVNGDGYADFIAGSPVANGASGAAYVVYGSASGPGAQASVTSPGATELGWLVAGVGDVNGDGFGDVVATSQVSTAFLYTGGPSGLSATPTVVSTGQVIPAVAGAVDFNGDGLADFALGVFSSLGAVNVYLGATGGAAPVVLQGTVANNNFGVSLAGAGDVNADGFDDLLVGENLADADQGGAYLFFGNASFSAAATELLIAPPAASLGLFGQGLAGAGDVNGDAIDDLVIDGFYNGGTSGTLSQNWVYEEGTGNAPTQIVDGTGFVGWSVQ